MSTYESLREELQAITRSTYIENAKQPPSYERKWSIYALFNDGTSHKMFTPDNDDALHKGLRRMIQMAKQHDQKGTP